MSYSRYTTNKQVTPQSKPIPGREAEMSKNYAGGFTFTLDKWGFLQRFLILGTDQPTYYAGKNELSQKAVPNVEACMKEDYRRTVDMAVDVIVNGRAKSFDPALFTIALVMKTHPNKIARKYAALKVSEATPYGTAFLTFVKFVKELGGGGRLTRAVMGQWFTEKNPSSLAYQVLKYQQRNGWSMSDTIHLYHPRSDNAEVRAILNYVTDGTLSDDLPDQIIAYETLKETNNPSEAAKLIREYRLTREMVPTTLLKSASVWEALLEDMPVGALIRNLNKLTAVGVVAPFSNGTMTVIEKLQSSYGYVHPYNVLIGMRTYEQGKGLKGSLTWRPVSQISDALEDRFYASFKQTAPSGKRTLIGMDVSGSMSWANGGILTARESAMAMAMVAIRTHSVQTHTMAFSHQFLPLNITNRTRLTDAIQLVSGMRFGRTDCALPMVYAKDNRIPVDTFIVYTDNETWYGRIQPVQALRDYREAMGIASKLIVVGVTATEFTIADPLDGGMLDVVGFDAGAPPIMAEFAK